MKYRIKGSIRYEFRNIRYVEVDGIYEGDTADEIIDRLVGRLTPYDDGELHDRDPDIEATPLENEAEDERELNYRLMRRLGPSVAPTLFAEEQIRSMQTE